MQYKLQKIKSDASFREFFRLFKGKKTSIIVTASKEKFKNLTAYSTINKFLRRNGVHTPKLISQHFNEGIIEIEDFGHKTLLEDVKKSKNKFTRGRKVKIKGYKKAIITLKKGQSIDLTTGI